MLKTKEKKTGNRKQERKISSTIKKSQNIENMIVDRATKASN